MTALIENTNLLHLLRRRNTFEMSQRDLQAKLAVLQAQDAWSKQTEVTAGALRCVSQQLAKAKYAIAREFESV